MRRRDLLVAGAALAAAPALAAPPRRMVALEWSIVSMLLSLGLPPVGMPEIAAYGTWVVEPRVPAGVQDVGVKTEPNLEAVAALRPDLILISPLSRPIVPQLESIAPVREVAIYTEAREPVRLATEGLRDLGALLGREPEADAVIRRCEAVFASARSALARRGDRPCLLISFLDAQHIRVFGHGSLFADVLGRVGLQDAWRGPSNVWGFTLGGLAEIAAYPEARILVAEPDPSGIAQSLDGPGLWRRLPAVRAGRTARLPAAWHYGDLVAAARFAASLPHALREAA